jgi:hypothetical protein
VKKRFYLIWFFVWKKRQTSISFCSFFNISQRELKYHLDLVH